MGRILPLKVKKKVKFSPCLMKHYAVKTWGNGGIATLFLTLGIDLVSFTPQSLYLPAEITAGTHWIGWVGPRVGLGAVEKKKIFHCWGSNLEEFYLYTLLMLCLFILRKFSHSRDQVS
jgi:hypothetical protein